MKKFKKNNESFVCINCKEEVQLHPTSSRDHCNNCLYGLHVDIFPGDRKNNCRGILEPIGIEVKNSKERIVYKCKNCSAIIKNISAPDDNKNVITILYQKIWKSLD